MTEAVAALVLKDAYAQTQTLSVTERLGAYLTDRIARYMRTLERSLVLDRALEFLPDEEELAERQQHGKGFSRPELCVLVSYAKNDLYSQLRDSAKLSDPYLSKELREYFPSRLSSNFGEAMERHRLREEIIATMLTNEVVNRTGITFTFEVSEKCNAIASDTVLAYVAARDIFEVRRLWAQIESLDNQVVTKTQQSMLAEIGRLVTATTAWLLQQRDFKHGIAHEIETFSAPIASLSASLTDVLSDADKLRHHELEQQYVTSAVPAALAHHIAGLPFLVSACDLVCIAQQTSRPILEAAQVYFEVGSHFGFEWLRDVARGLQAGKAWDKQAVAGIADDLFAGQRRLTIALLDETSNELPAKERLAVWQESHPQHARVERLLGELRASAKPELSMLSVAARQLTSLAARH
jgi:glutamate dehydrogenase